MTTEKTRRYTAEQMLAKAKRLDWTGAETAGMLTQAATDATRLQSMEAENARLREDLAAIRLYANDTLSGPVNPEENTREWHREAVVELRNRARNALEED
jgi:hypothetical protein